MDLPARTKAELKAWYAEAREVQERILASEELHTIPHSLWHFFSDADVRARSPEDREGQFEQVRQHIAVLATGAIPPDDSREVDFGTFLRELWSFIRGKDR
ncbi:hypothetical protein K8638_38310 [Myxococcus sp. RHST-1-4]|nr:hypothetical protein [Myxococcus sp. RHSTA-1-4]